MLLYPERGLLLNATGAAIVQLCTGEHTVEGIVARLAEKYPGQTATAIEGEVLAFLGQMVKRSLVVLEE